MDQLLNYIKEARIQCAHIDTVNAWQESQIQQAFNALRTAERAIENAIKQGKDQ